MDLDPPPTAQENADALLQAVGRGVARVPHKPLILLGLFLFAAGLMAVHTALTPKDSILRLKVQHSFRSAQLSVWLDDDRIYSGPLIGSSPSMSLDQPAIADKPISSGNRSVSSHKQARSRRRTNWGKKKIGAGKKPASPGTIVSESRSASQKAVDSIQPVEGSLSETFTVTAGAHEVRVRVAAEDGSAQENSIRGDFASESQRTLSVVAGGNDVAMNWQSENQAAASAANPAPEPTSSAEGWFSRYAGSLFISLIGSIISAVTGFVIREIPKKIVAKQVGR